MPRKIDLTNHKYGKLTVKERAPNKNYRISWVCICECGSEKIATGNDLRRGKVYTCGSFKCRENIDFTKRIEACTTHGASKTRLYLIWAGMRGRCRRPHVGYSNRGIKVCKEWETFENFRDWSNENGYNDTLTIDRIDVNGNYCPENCRWVTRKEQARNTRSNKIIEYNGKKQCLFAWAEELNMNTRTLYDRIRREWSVEKAFNTPSRSKYEGPR